MEAACSARGRLLPYRKRIPLGATVPDFGGGGGVFDFGVRDAGLFTACAAFGAFDRGGSLRSSFVDSAAAVFMVSAIRLRSRSTLNTVTRTF